MQDHGKLREIAALRIRMPRDRQSPSRLPMTFHTNPRGYQEAANPRAERHRILWLIFRIVDSKDFDRESDKVIKSFLYQSFHQNSIRKLK